jgi:hypothetical protein
MKKKVVKKKKAETNILLIQEEIEDLIKEILFAKNRMIIRDFDKARQDVSEFYDRISFYREETILGHRKKTEEQTYKVSSKELDKIHQKSESFFTNWEKGNRQSDKKCIASLDKIINIFNIMLKKFI